jgi:hypothetical protein
MHPAELPTTEVAGAEAAADVAKTAADVTAANMATAKAATHVATAMSRHGHAAGTERGGSNCCKYDFTHSHFTLHCH